MRLVNYQMGNLIVNFIMLLSLGNFISCQSDEGYSYSTGKLNVSLGVDTVSLKKTTNGLTKSAIEEPDQALLKFLDTSDYSVSIVKDDKDTVSRFDRFDLMPAQLELPEGSYKFVASKGLNHSAAFDNPYFEGSSRFVVKGDMSTSLSVTCTMANVRITTEYTEAFKKRYSKYTALFLTSYLDSAFQVGKDETKPLYMKVAPEGSEISMGLRLQHSADSVEKTYKIPAPLLAEPRQNIRLVFKAGPETSGTDSMRVDIFLDDSLTNVTLTEGIPDFIWQQFDKPSLKALNFGDGEFDIHAGSFNEEPKILFKAPAGIGEFKIDVWEGTESIDEASTVTHYDIATLEGATLAQAAHYSWSLPEVMLKSAKLEGELYLKDAINSLTAPTTQDSYTYYMRIQMKDQLPKSNQTEAFTLKIIVRKAGSPIITFNSFNNIIEGDAQKAANTALIFAQAGIDKQNTTLTVSSSGSAPEVYAMSDAVAIAKLEQMGIVANQIDATKISLTFEPTFSSKLQALSDHTTYTYKIDLQEEGELKRTTSVSKSIEVKAPKFTLTSTEGDAFAKRIVLRAEMEDGTHPEKLKFQWRESGTQSWKDLSDAVYTQESIADTLKGLTPGGSTYEIRAVYNNKENRITQPIAISTESVVNLPDGEFENWHSEKVYSDKTLWVGRDIYQWFPYSSGSSSWWTTRNALTNSQNGGATCYYTSYSGTVPTDDGYNGKAAEVSTLGFGEGSTFATAGQSAKRKAAGMLFLGSHTATPGGGSETFDYGKTFTSKPSGFEFYYKFQSLNNESFKAYAVVENRTGGTVTELGRGTILSNASQESFTKGRVNIKYEKSNLKPTHFYIVFISSSASDPAIQSVWGTAGEFAGNSDSRFVGNVLTIDNVKLIYE